MKFKFPLGSTVYHLLEPEEPGLVTGILMRPGTHMYYVTWVKEEGSHYELELTSEKGYKAPE